MGSSGEIYNFDFNKFKYRNIHTFAKWPKQYNVLSPLSLHTACIKNAAFANYFRLLL